MTTSWDSPRSSTVSDRECALIVGLILDRISEDRFLREFPVGPAGPRAAALAILKRAAQAKDPVGVEMGLCLGHRFGMSMDFLEILCELVEADWHKRHEDAVSGLAKLKSPASVDVLYGAALSRHAYREYDEAYSLGVKAIYALAAIQTSEAIEKLGMLMRCNNDILASEARMRIEELEHSGATNATKEAARRLLESPGPPAPA